MVSNNKTCISDTSFNEMENINQINGLEGIGSPDMPKNGWGSFAAPGFKNFHKKFSEEKNLSKEIAELKALIKAYSAISHEETEKVEKSLKWTEMALWLATVIALIPLIAVIFALII